MRRVLAAMLAVGVLSTASLVPAVAQAEPTAKERAEALKVAGEALDLYEAGDYKAALARFIKADELLPATTLKLRIARCLNKLDRMQEAAEKYREVIATELAANAPKPHKEAREEAVPELAALLEEIPTLTIMVEGEGAADAVVAMEGTELPRELVGVGQELDPGSYIYEARVGERVAKENVVVERGAKLRVVLVLPPPSEDDDPEESSGSGMRVAGWAAVAVGGAALSVGSILGVLVLGEHGDIEARCPDGTCVRQSFDDQLSESDVDAFNAKGTATTAMLIVGGVGVALGATLLLIDMGGAEDGDVGLHVAPNGAWLRGSF